MLVDTLREALHQVAGVLVWPVLIGLLLLAGGALFELGAYLREAVDRWRGRRASLERDRARLAQLAVTADGDLDLCIESALQEAERRRWRQLHRLRLAVRVGPSLGLMGTLIPMANALQGLADGNLPALASNMVTAFAATVIGLTISVIAYLIGGARETWTRMDNDALALDAERVSREHRHAA